MVCCGGRALIRLGPFTGYQTLSNSECRDTKFGSETTGDKFRGQKGNSPDRRLRSLNYAKWQRKCYGRDSQDVGLEAATHSKSA
jgi:hypothetical protein